MSRMPQQSHLADQHLDAEIRRYLASRAASVHGLLTADDSIRALTARLSSGPAGSTTANRGTGRPKTMFNATKVAAAAAILTLGVGLAISRVGLDPEPQSVAPGAEATFVVPSGGAFFTGQMRYDGRPPTDAGQTQEFEEGGLAVSYVPLGFVGQTFTTSDPRLTGTRSELDTSFISDGAVEIWTERSVIENADGAWTCVLTSVASLESEQLPPVPLGGWCDGAGAYEGLHADMSIQTGGESGSSLPVMGFVSEAEGPLIPASE